MVSVADINGQRFIGVNSHNFTEVDVTRVKKWESELGVPNGRPGKFQRQMLCHAEANTLMQIYDSTGGQMPSKMTIFVDKIACSACQNNLPALVESMGIDILTIKIPDGRTAILTSDCFIGDWQ